MQRDKHIKKKHSKMYINSNQNTNKGARRQKNKQTK